MRYIIKHMLVLIFSGMGIGVGLYNLYASYIEEEIFKGICFLIAGGAGVGLGLALIVSVCLKVMIY